METQGEFRVTLFGFDGEAVELLDVTKIATARKVARDGTRRPGVAYATVPIGDRLDVFARGRNRLRIKRS